MPNEQEQPEDEDQSKRVNWPEHNRDLREVVSNMRTNLEMHLEFNKIQAILLHGKFVALVEAGFKPEQAFTLIVERGLS